MSKKIFHSENSLTISSDKTVNKTLNKLSVSVPSNIAVKGWIADCNSIALKNYKPLENASVVNFLLENSATLKGNTIINEFNFGLSSNTSADAVSQKFVDVSLVVDYMGQTLMLSALNNLVGFKPSYNVISRFGLNGIIPSMECCGIITNNLNNLFEVLKVISLKDNNDLNLIEINFQESFNNFDVASSKPIENSLSKEIENASSKPIENGLSKEIENGSSKTIENGSSKKKFKIAVFKEIYDLFSENELKKFKNLIDYYRKIGIEIAEINFPDFNIIKNVHTIIGSVEASSSCGKYDSVRYGHRTKSSKNWNEMYLKSREESFGSLIKQYLFQGGFFQYKKYDTYKNACSLRTKLNNEVKKVYEKFDAILMPVIKESSLVKNENQFKRYEISNEMYDMFEYVLLPSLLGFPSVTLPNPVRNNVSNFGFQLIGNIFNDVKLLKIAESIIT